MTKSVDKRRELRARLKDARKAMIQGAVGANAQGNQASQLEFECRRRLVDSLLAEVDGARHVPWTSRRVFVSYSKRTGGQRHRVLKSLLEEHGFECKTGFDRPDTKDANTLARVLRSLEMSAFYIGIFTKEHEITVNSSESIHAPGVWLVEEKGMALARRMPCMFLIEEGVDERFWMKTTPERYHHMFTPRTFRRVAESAVEEMAERFDSLILDFLQS